MAEQHPINGLMGTSMEKIRELVDVNTIIGDPITSPDGTIIIPVSKVSFGFVAGGSDLPTKAPKEVFAGGSGAGISHISIVIAAFFKTAKEYEQLNYFVANKKIYRLLS